MTQRAEATENTGGSRVHESRLVWQITCPSCRGGFMAVGADDVLLRHRADEHNRAHPGHAAAVSERRGAKP